MIENILVIDDPTEWKWYKQLLEETLKCRVGVVWSITEAKELLDTRNYNLVIIEPYTVQPRGSYARGEFVKNDLRNRNVPFVVSSTQNQDSLSTFAGLKDGEDYQEYLKKHFKLAELLDKIKKLSG